VTYAITWTPRAVDLATQFLKDDPDGLRAVFDAIDALADEPRPSNTFPFGATDLLRLRVGRYRVVYEIHNTERAITVMHIGRSA
jgi:mRNA interferase RelE/StbE